MSHDVDVDLTEGTWTVLDEIAKRVKLLAWAVTLTVFSALGLALFVVTITGFAVVVVSVGVPMLIVCLPLVRRLADFHRRWAGAHLGTAIPSAYQPLPEGNALLRWWATVKDPATRRDLMWLLVNSTAGLALYIASIVECLLGLVFWWLPTHILLDVNAHIARKLLSPGERSQLEIRCRNSPSHARRPSTAKQPRSAASSATCTTARRPASSRSA